MAHYWLVSHPAEMRDLIEVAVHREGGQREAARRSKVSQSTFSRLLHPPTDKSRASLLGPPPRGYPLSEPVAKRLQKWLPSKERAVFEACCLRHDVQHRIAELEGERRKMLGEGSARGVAREILYCNLKAQEPTLFESFEERLAAQGVKVDRGLTEVRALEALARILDPLLDAEASDGLDPTWRELARRKARKRPDADRKRAGAGGQPSTLRKFLKLGMDRELLLLDQDPRGVRAQRRVAEDFKRSVRQKDSERGPGPFDFALPPALTQARTHW